MSEAMSGKIPTADALVARGVPNINTTCLACGICLELVSRCTIYWWTAYSLGQYGGRYVFGSFYSTQRILTYDQEASKLGYKKHMVNIFLMTL
ncbi:hypothetical protein Hdeb2414_s0025g00661211 [Helianthus debilis subsp. tardiflorus]